MTPVLNWIKANLAIVIMCAVMIVTLPTVVFVSGRMNSSLQQAISERADKQIKELTRLQSTNIAINPLVPGAQALDEKVTLNDAVLDQYRTLRERIKSDADDLIAAAIKINRSGKGVLVEGLLPAPDVARQEELPFEIYGAYRAAHEQLLQQLQAGMPIDNEDLRFQLEEHDRNFRRSQFNTDPGVSLGESDRKKLEEEMAKRRIAIYGQIAADQSVYANLDIFTLDQWDSGQKPAPQQWWEWQQIYWLHADLVDAINRANQKEAGSLAFIEDDPGSAIKRIISISADRVFSAKPRTSSKRDRRGRGSSKGGEGGGEFGGEYGGGEGFMGLEGGGFEEGMMKGGGGSRSKGPKKVESNFDDATQPFTLDFSQTISGRNKKTALYDIRKVEMVLVVDTRQIQTIFDAINQTSLMTVTGCRMQSVDISSHLSGGFYYGSVPVIEMTITLETLWLRDWTVPLMPQEVQEYFGISTDENNEDGG